jgi:DNA modification methylase
MLAAAQWGRNSIGVEVDPHYAELALARLKQSLPKPAKLSVGPSG